MNEVMAKGEGFWDYCFQNPYLDINYHDNHFLVYEPGNTDDLSFVRYMENFAETPGDSSK